jgi:hypothetical protein
LILRQTDLHRNAIKDFNLRRNQLTTFEYKNKITFALIGWQMNLSTAGAHHVVSGMSEYNFNRTGTNNYRVFLSAVAEVEREA